MSAAWDSEDNASSLGPAHHLSSPAARKGSIQSSSSAFAAADAQIEKRDVLGAGIVRRGRIHWWWWGALLLATFFFFKLHFPVVLMLRQGFAFMLPVHPSPHSLIVELLECSGRVMDEHGIVWFLDEGTLLGSIREGDVIRGDSDIDIGTFTYQNHLMPAAMAEIRSRCGYYIVTRDDCKGVPGFSSFTAKRIAWRIMPGYFGPNWFIDVRDYEVDPDGAVYDVEFVDDNDTPFVHIRDILPLIPCTLRGRTFRCPRDPLVTIIDEFGETWSTPIKGFKTYMLQREATYKLLPKYAEAAAPAALAAAALAAAGGNTGAGAATGAAPSAVAPAGSSSAGGN